MARFGIGNRLVKINLRKTFDQIVLNRCFTARMTFSTKCFGERNKVAGDVPNYCANDSNKHIFNTKGGGKRH